MNTYEEAQRILNEVSMLNSIVRSTCVIVFIVAISALSACTKTEDYLRDMVIKYSDFVNPSSAMFRNLTYSDVHGSWCGEVNSKNRMGGYIGWRRFSLTVSKDGKATVTVHEVDKHFNFPENLRELLHAADKLNYELICGSGVDAQPSSSWVPFWK